MAINSCQLVRLGRWVMRRTLGFAGASVFVTTAAGAAGIGQRYDFFHDAVMGDVRGMAGLASIMD